MISDQLCVELDLWKFSDYVTMSYTGQQVLPCFNTSSPFLFPRTKNSSYASTAIYRKNKKKFSLFFGDETVCETDISTDWFFVQIYRSQNKSMDLLFVFGCHWYVIPVIPQSSPSWGHFRRKDHLFQPREAHGFWGLSTHHWGGGAVEVWRSGRGSEDSKNLISKIPPCFWPRIMTKIAAPKWWDEISEASENMGTQGQHTDPSLLVRVNT